MKRPTLSAAAVRAARPALWQASEARRHRLDNGLEICLLPRSGAPVVTSALFYRAGTRDETPGLGGTAHFLEHMMFKGTDRIGPGEIDRRTLAQGGSNNAYTSHDHTAYYFDFARDRWGEALAMEADRMAGLSLDAAAVESERRVIEEEIGQAENDPWDLLETAVWNEAYGDHAYGRPVLGTRSELARIDGEVLADFHHRFYHPANAFLVLAGDLGQADVDRAAEIFGPLAAGPGSGAPPAAPTERPGIRRVTLRRGEVRRFFFVLPAPPTDAPNRGALRLLLTALGVGRSSRLQRAMVDEGQLCSWISVDLTETLDPGRITLAGELVPGVDPAAVEERLFASLASLRAAPPDDRELERARRMTVADWVFSHEKVHSRALLAGWALSLFDLALPERQLESLLQADASALLELARRWLDPEKGAVLGWSLPADEEAASDA